MALFSLSENEYKTAEGDKALRGFSGYDLKIIALITMFVDHFAEVILLTFISASGYTDYSQAPDMQWISQNWALYLLYVLFVCVGRLSFPLFCFCLVEGFVYTKSRVKFFIRLFVFALISEIPFDLAFYGQLIYKEQQNVIVTLLLGFCFMWVANWFSQKVKIKSAIVSLLLDGVIASFFATIAYYLKSDYNACGVIMIALMYEFRINRKISMALGVIAATIYSTIEVVAILDVFLVERYNNTVGKKMKYLFYTFYPAHLLVLYFVNKLLI